jgi:hypothetical protein
MILQIKSTLKGKRFQDVEGIQKVMTVLEAIPQEFQESNESKAVSSLYKELIEQLQTMPTAESSLHLETLLEDPL